MFITDKRAKQDKKNSGFKETILEQHLFLEGN